MKMIAAVLVLLALGQGQSARACDKHHHEQERSDAAGVTRSLHRYDLPNVTLTDQDGRAVGLDTALPRDRDVAVNFIFTTCGTVCPVLSATFRGLREQTEGRDVQLVSITIDPEHDRPSVLKAYARRFDAPRDWRFYTGSAQQIRSVLTAFNALTGDKANHRPVTLLRRAGEDTWTRFEGFPGAHDLAEQLRAP